MYVDTLLEVILLSICSRGCQPFHRHDCSVTKLFWSQPQIIQDGKKLSPKTTLNTGDELFYSCSISRLHKQNEKIYTYLQFDLKKYIKGMVYLSK